MRVPVLSAHASCCGVLPVLLGDEEGQGSTRSTLERAARYAELSFTRNIEPALDGHLVIGARGDEAVLVYRTQEGDLRPLAQAVDGSAELRPLEGYDDTVVTSDSSPAIVGSTTAVLVEGAGNPSADLLQLEGDDAQPFTKVFGAPEATISADPGATVATARLDLRD